MHDGSGNKKKVPHRNEWNALHNTSCELFQMSQLSDCCQILLIINLVLGPKNTKFLVQWCTASMRSRRYTNTKSEVLKLISNCDCNKISKNLYGIHPIKTRKFIEVGKFVNFDSLNSKKNPAKSDSNGDIQKLIQEIWLL